MARAGYVLSGLGPAAVALADQLARLDARAEARLRRTLSAVAPPGYLDQVAAAQDEALAVAVRSVGRAPVMVEAPEWLRLLVVETALAYVTGQAETCPCAPTVQRPAPVYAAAWRPGVVACSAHADYLFALAGEAALTCDRCGSVAEAIATGMIVAGPLTFQFGLCSCCEPELCPVPLRVGTDARARRGPARRGRSSRPGGTS